MNENLTKEELEQVDKASRLFSVIIMSLGSLIVFAIMFGILTGLVAIIWMLIKLVWGIG